MSQRTLKIMFSAGESSGDRHAAHMYLEMKDHRPQIEAIGMGGKAMREAGIRTDVDSSGIGVIGLTEVIRHYAEIRSALRLMRRLILSETPDLLICVDYKEFNLKLAQFAKKNGIKVLFYVSPQVWAWRPSRVATYGRAIDMMAVIFPFETAYYEKEHIPVRYVGHPLVDKVVSTRTREENCRVFDLVPKQRVVGLLPGSRQHEVKRMLPVMLEAAAILGRQHQDLQFLLVQADSIDDELVRSCFAKTSIDCLTIKHQAYDAVSCCDAVMTTSGTATLEVALLQVPMVIVYKLAAVTYWLGRMLVHTPFIGLPNIIAGKAIVKELIQHDARAATLAAEIDRILSDENYRGEMLSNLQAVKRQLGDGGGSRNTARLALELLNNGI